MFSKPRYGWSHFNYCGVEAEASYLIDIPVDWTDALLAYYKLPLVGWVLPIEEEGSQVNIVKTQLGIYALYDREIVSVQELEACTAYQFVLDYCEDMERDIDAWVDFTTRDLTEKELESRKEGILNKIRELRELAKAWHERIG